MLLLQSPSGFDKTDECDEAVGLRKCHDSTCNCCNCCCVPGGWKNEHATGSRPNSHECGLSWWPGHGWLRPLKYVALVTFATYTGSSKLTNVPKLRRLTLRDFGLCHVTGISSLIRVKVFLSRLETMRFASCSRRN